MKTDIPTHSISRNPIANRPSIDRLLLDIFLFMIPTLKFMEISIGGRLYLPEILLSILFMAKFVVKNIKFDTKLAKTLLTFCLLWLFGQIFTDILRGSAFIDYARGWAKIVFTIINFSVLYFLLINKNRLIIIFASGLVAGGILEFYLNPGVYTAGSPWKFGVGTSFTLLFVLAAASISLKRPSIRIGLLVIICITNIVLGFRSMGGICFLTAVYLSLQWRWNRKKIKPPPLSIKGIAILSTVIIAASFLLIQVYGYAARQGILGEGARKIYNWQAHGELGLLIGGRSEILASSRAILDSPFIGHGSWAKNEKYADALMDYKSRIGYYAIPYEDEDLIPTHSHLFGAWVEAGILGAIFWVWLLVLPIRSLLIMYQTKERLSPLYAFVCFILIWDIFFSPYAGDRRFITPFYMVVLINYLSGLRRSEKFPVIEKTNNQSNGNISRVQSLKH